MIGFPRGETVTIVRPSQATRDEYGNDVAGAPVEILVVGCAVAPSGAGEDVQARDQVSSALTVWMPAGTQVNATDKVRVAGVLYDVDGTSRSWTSAFTGLTAPVEVSLTRVRG